jgi:hypothetical protein
MDWTGFYHRNNGHPSLATGEITVADLSNPTEADGVESGALAAAGVSGGGMSGSLVVNHAIWLLADLACHKLLRALSLHCALPHPSA